MKRVVASRFPFRFLLLAALAIPCWSGFRTSANAQEAEAYKWSVQYLIDQSQRVADRPQTVYPRHNRALAISSDGQFLYAGYHQGIDGTGEVRKIDLNETDYISATLRVLRGLTPKAIAVDSEGRVYIAVGDKIAVYDSNLKNELGTIDTMQCEGVATAKEGSKTILFATERNRRLLCRWTIETGNSGEVTGKPDGLGGSGQIEIQGAVSPRGLCIDQKGRILVADIEANKVFRIEPDGKSITSADVMSPVAVACDGVKVLVTQFVQRQITILEENMVAIGTLSVPWEQLELAPRGNNELGALSGIVVIPGHGFIVANERGQTANQKSAYGRTDDFSRVINDKAYMDAAHDDNEPILRAVPMAVSAR